MKNLTISFKPILLVVICFVFLSCTQVKKDKLPDPQIAAGIAKVTGKVTSFHLKKGEANPTLNLSVPNPVTAEPGKFETKLSNDGSFYFEVPVECTFNIGMIWTDAFDDNCVSVGLIPGEVTKIEISYDTTDQLKATMVSSLGLTSSDLPYYYKMFINFIEDREDQSCYTMTPEDFSHFAIEKLMAQRLKRSIIDSLLSDKAKNLITNQLKLMYLGGCLLTYKDYITTNYLNFKPKGEPDNFTAQEPNRSYYAFLKEFNLGDPQYLYNDRYSMVLKYLLTNKTLNIPAIKDMPVEVWLKEVKTIMADLIGSDTGLFYNMLAANASALQFNNEIKPLSDKQKENIRSYFKNEEVTKILLKRNEEIIKLDEENQHIITTINTTPAVPKEALMNAIISKYKGKAVLVDFWATWCQPCMVAMQANKVVKSEMHDKNVAFVYITNLSSPMELWQEKIKMIGGEQYYLTNDEWEYIMNSFEFTGIPSYLFYDTKGIMKNKITAYPGAEKMQKMIGELLP